MTLRIVLADDHAVVRRELRRLLEAEDDWVVCGEANNGWEAVRLCEALRPDLVVLDMSMPLMGGVQATRRIREIAPATVVAMLSMDDHKGLVATAIQAGARAFILKSEAPERLVPAIRAILR